MVNVQPKTEHLKQTQYSRDDEGIEALANSQTQVVLEKTVHDAVRRMGKAKAGWLRRVIREAAEREGLI